MARGRVVTPDFWTDGNIVALSPLARLFYLGMWNFAHCDKGHLDDDVVGLKLKILPTDNVDPTNLLMELVNRQRVVRIRADNGKSFLLMPTFYRWQKTDPRWKTRCPACALINSGELTETPVSFAEHSETHPISALREEKKREPERKEENQRENALSSVDLLFGDAYSHWPKKVERKAALAKFKAAVKKRPAETLAQDIIRFGDAYALATTRQFTPALGTWLERERWDDDLPVADTARKPTRTDQNLDFVAQLQRDQEQAQRGITA